MMSALDRSLQSGVDAPLINNLVSMIIAVSTARDGENFTITGASFGSTGTVTVGGITCTIISWENDAIVAVAPTVGVSYGPRELVITRSDTGATDTWTVDYLPPTGYGYSTMAVSYGDLPARSLFYGRQEFSMLVAGDQVAYKTAASPSGNVHLDDAAVIVITGAPPAGNVSFDYFTIDTSDGYSRSLIETITWLEASNAPPTLVGTIGPLAVTTGTIFSINVADFFSDADGDPLTYSAVGLPAGLDVISNSIAGTCTAEPGIYTVNVTANDGRGGITTSNSFTITVTDGISPVVIGATINADGTQLSVIGSEALTYGAQGAAGFILNMSGGAVAATYLSGNLTNTFTYALSRIVRQGETGTLSYVQPGAGISDNASPRNMLQSFSGLTVTNSSTSVLDVTPAAFTLSSATGLEPGATIYRDVTVSGLDSGVTVVAEPLGDATAAKSAGGTGPFGIAGTESLTVQNGDVVRVYLTSPATFGGQATGALDINGVSAAFTATTRAAVIPTLTGLIATRASASSLSWSLHTTSGVGALRLLVNQNPTATPVEVIAASNIVTVSASGTQSGTIGSLTTGQTVYLHALQQGEANSAVVNSVSVTLTADDFSAPVILAASINAAGNTITLTASEPVTFANSGGFAVEMQETPVTLTYLAGIGTSQLSYSLSANVYNTDSGLLAFTPPGNGIRDLATTPNYMAGFDNLTITNGSQLQHDVTVTAFTLTDIAGLELNVPTYRDVTVAGIDSVVKVPATALGSASLLVSTNGGATFGQLPVSNLVGLGDIVRVNLQASNQYNTPVSGGVDIGGVSDIYTATTRAADTTPTTFTMSNVGGLELGAVRTQDILVSGVDPDVNVSISRIGVSLYSVSTDGGVTWSAQTSATGTVRLGDVVRVYLTAANTYGTSVSGGINIGGVTASRTLTTRNAVAGVLSGASASRASQSSVNWGVTLDRAAGTLCVLVSSNSSVAISVIKSTGLQVPITASGAYSGVIGGQAVGSDVYVHYIHTDETNSNLVVIGPVALTADAAIDTTSPTPVSASVSADGRYLQLRLSEIVTRRPSGSVFSLTVNGLTVALLNQSMAGDLFTAYLPQRVYAGDIVLLSHLQSGDGVEDSSGNDLGTFTNFTVTNGSTWVHDVAIYEFTLSDALNLSPGVDVHRDVIVDGLGSEDNVLTSVIGSAEFQVSINGGLSWTARGTNPTLVTNGYIVRVYLRSPLTYGTGVTGGIDIGGVSDTFTAVTRAAKLPQLTDGEAHRVNSTRLTWSVVTDSLVGNIKALVSTNPVESLETVVASGTNFPIPGDGTAVGWKAQLISDTTYYVHLVQLGEVTTGVLTLPGVVLYSDTTPEEEPTLPEFSGQYPAADFASADGFQAFVTLVNVLDVKAIKQLVLALSARIDALDNAD